MGRGRGRPTKKGKSSKNPFDLNIGRKLLKGGTVKRRGCWSKVCDGALANNTFGMSMEEEASKIIDTAIGLGLSVPKGRLDSVLALSKGLEDGDL